MLILAACGQKGNDAEQKVERILPPEGFFTEDFILDEQTIRSGETFSALMARLGLDPSKTQSLIQIGDSLFNVGKILAGNRTDAYYSGDSLDRKLEYVVYRHNKIRSTVFQCGDSLAVWNIEKPVTGERKYADVSIRTSLWNDMLEAGISPILIVNLADIYQWSVNFFGLQEGDRFRVVYTQSVCDNEVIAIDTVHFALFSRGDYEVPALRFDCGKGHNTYWGKNGESLKKMFLKAPLKYNRISSRFTYHRKHPVTGRVRPHTAVDYAAPKGTPVHAIADGRISVCGWDSKGGGNHIRIKHAQQYESCYMHLSGYAKGIKRGATVHQGQLIGYVGSTGRSTGPHLDFRIWHKGKPINPLSLNSPSSEPLDKKHIEEFNALYWKYIKEVKGESVISESQDPSSK